MLLSEVGRLPKVRLRDDLELLPMWLRKYDCVLLPAVLLNTHCSAASRAHCIPWAQLPYTLLPTRPVASATDYFNATSSRNCRRILPTNSGCSHEIGRAHV